MLCAVSGSLVNQGLASDRYPDASWLEDASFVSNHLANIGSCDSKTEAGTFIE